MSYQWKLEKKYPPNLSSKRVYWYHLFEVKNILICDWPFKPKCEIQKKDADPIEARFCGWLVADNLTFCPNHAPRIKMTLELDTKKTKRPELLFDRILIKDSEQRESQRSKA